MRKIENKGEKKLSRALKKMHLGKSDKSVEKGFQAVKKNTDKINKAKDKLNKLTKELFPAPTRPGLNNIENIKQNYSEGE